LKDAKINMTVCRNGPLGFNRGVLLVVSFLGIMLAVFTSFSSADAFSDGKANFKVKVRDEVIPYKVMAVFVLPEARMELEVQKQRSNLPPTITDSGGGFLEKKEEDKWEWHAPDHPSLCKLKIRYADDYMVIHAFVMAPFNELKGGYVNGYRIGEYPRYSMRFPFIYEPPKGFIEVTRDNEKTFVSPHFRLAQFLCKQDQGFPKYIVLREKLLLKLEYLLEKVNQAGYKCDSFHVMSGYRTPYYNQLLGNVKYSRHQWGGAADIFIDENPKDGMMDDLNKDGKIDWKDAKVLYRIVDGEYGKARYKRFVGGLGRYKGNHYHGPFVHVDVRGKKARWE
jgi:hypothetical protein